MAKLLLTKTRNLNFFLTLIASFLLITTGWGMTDTTAVANPYAYSQAGLANPTVTSDKDDYAPGEIAIITGTGWTLDSVVDIHLEEDPNHNHHHGYHDIQVDANGNWRIEYPIEDRHLGVAFTVIVDGRQSKYQGLAYFTDGRNDYTSQISPVSTCVGVNQNYTLTLDNVSTDAGPPNQPRDIRSVRIIIPSGLVLAHFSNISISVPTGKNWSNANTSTAGEIRFSASGGQSSILTGESITISYQLNAPNNGTYTWNTILTDNSNFGGNSFDLVTMPGNTKTTNYPTTTVTSSVTPSVSIAADSGTTICQNSSVTFTATPTNGGSAPTYQWKINGNNVGVNSSTPTFTSSTLSDDDKVTVVMTSNAECRTSSTATSNELTMTVNSAPTVSATNLPASGDISNTSGLCSASVAFGENVTAGGTPTPTLTYSLVSGDFSSPITSPYSFPVGTTTVYVRAENGCGEAFSSFTVTVTDDEDPTVSVAEAAVTANTSDDGAGDCTVDVAIADATFGDNCSGESLAWELTGATTGSGTGQVGTQTFNIGQTTITYTVTDAAGLTETASMTVTVTDDEKPVITCVANQTRSNDSGTCSYKAIGTEFDLTWYGDNCSVETIINDFNNSSTLAGAEFPEGETVVEWTVTDTSGNETSCSFTVIVTNNDPVITNISGPIGPQQKGTSVTLTANYVDNNLASAVWEAYSNDVLVTTQAGTINHNDGTVSGSFNLNPDVYIVKLIITDHCGETAEAYYEYIVIFDPTGGFVTGGGWIDSPVGASKLYPLVTGKANFGFNAKYKNGKNNTNEVDGNTNFQFKAGDLHFSSSAHHNMSLVISGAKATYTGEGTINGSGSYEFRLIAIDGDLLGNSPDKFRIKIWTKGNPSDVIYDNQRGTSESSDDATILGGGSIVIHKPKSNNKTADVVEKTVAIEGGVELTTVEILSSLAVAPNPVKTDARVRFSLIEDAEVALRVYDFGGREVARLFSGNLKANQVQEVEFLRRNLPSGVYIVKLTTDRGNSYDRQIILE